MKSKTDSELVKRFQEGDNKAFDELQRRHQDKIFRITRRYARDSEEARELCQEVFLRAFEKLSSFKGKSKFYTWLYRVANNLCVDFHRKRSRVFVTDLPEDFLLSYPIERADEKFDPLNLIEKEELHRKVRQAISRLPRKQRHVLILRYYGELKISEIAPKVGSSEGTVKAQLFHAKRKLAKMLRGYFIDSESAVLAEYPVPSKQMSEKIL